MIPSIQSNDRQTPIEHKYREGNVKRTLGMELKVHQIDKLRKWLDFLRNSLSRQLNLETVTFPKCVANLTVSQGVEPSRLETRTKETFALASLKFERIQTNESETITYDPSICLRRSRRERTRKMVNYACAT